MGMATADAIIESSSAFDGSEASCRTSSPVMPCSDAHHGGAVGTAK